MKNLKCGRTEEGVNSKISNISLFPYMLPNIYVSKITVDHNLLLGRKVMTNLDSILKSRDITLSKKVRLVKAMVFPIVMYGYESWIIKKAEHQLLNYGVGLLRILCTTRRSNQSILKEISPEYLLLDLMLELKLQYLATWYEELTHFKRPWCWEILKVRGEGDNIGWDDWMTSPTQWTWVWVNSRSWWWTGRPDVLQSM